MIRHSVCAALKLSTRLSLAFLLICFSGVSSSSQAQIFKVPFASLSPNYAPLWAADAAGLFRKYHLDVQPIYISSGSVVVPALLSGEVKIANISGAAAITAWARGADLALLAVSSDRLLHAVMTSANIKKPEDLKGKKIGVAFALERLAATFPDAAKLRADDFLDGEIMLELEREGFIKEIYSERPTR